MSDPSSVPDSSFDTTCVITSLVVYPIKSCAGVAVQEALLIDTGLEFDRAWMVVDDKGEFLTQRELPRMALIQPQLKHYEMVLRAPGMLALHVKLDEVEAPVRVRVWDDDVAAFDMGAIAAQWFTDFLGVCCRLVRYDPDHVGRILHSLGLSVQKPEALARERDAKAIRRWRSTDWPRIKKTRDG